MSELETLRQVNADLAHLVKYEAALQEEKLKTNL